MTWIVVLQIVTAATLGAVVGLERELSSQPAGLRTHMLVALGAAVFTLAGTEITRGDPTRIAAQVVTGIGFLGGGAIVRYGATTRGLTTAASLWVTAAIGLAVGLEAWLAATLTTGIALLVLYVIRLIEREYLPSHRRIEATLTLERGTHLDSVERAATAALPDGRVLRVTYSDSGQALVLVTRLKRGESIATLGERLRALPGVAGVDLAP